VRTDRKIVFVIYDINVLELLDIECTLMTSLWSSDVKLVTAADVTEIFIS
jgi:hypothetical protein